MLFDFPMHTIDSALRFPRRAAAKTFDGKFKFGKRKMFKQNKKTSRRIAVHQMYYSVGITLYFFITFL